MMTNDDFFFFPFHFKLYYKSAKMIVFGFGSVLSKALPLLPVAANCIQKGKRC